MHLQVCSSGNIKHIRQKILDCNNVEFNSTVGPIVPIGAHRLKLFKYFNVLLHKTITSVDILFLNLGVFNVCCDFFFHYIWNNFLNSNVAEMICFFLETRSPELC